jgi:hypothetical protein
MLKKSVLLGSGLLSFQQVNQIAASLASCKVVAVIGDRRGKNDKDGVFSQAALSTNWKRFHFNDLLKQKPFKSKTPYTKDITQYVLSDPNAYLIAERCMLGGYFASVSKRLFLIETIICNVLKIQETYKIAKFVQTNIPHNIDWYLAKVFEFLRLEVLYTRVCSPLERVQLVSGVTFPKTLTAPRNLSEHKINKLTNSVLSHYKQNYEQARPDYEKENVKRRGKGLLTIKSIWADLSRIDSTVKSGWIVNGIIKKINAFVEFSSYNKIKSTHKKIIKFFLHYQPEATTIPAGCWYSSQNNAILELSKNLPDGVSLALREHPSTFRLTFDDRYRWPEFYKKIAQLHDVKWLKIEADVFTEFKNTAFAATITGNVGFESICKGIPCLVFSQTFYSGLEGVFTINKESNLKKLMNKIMKKTIKVSKLKKGIKNLFKNSFDYNPKINGSIPGLIYLCNFRGLARKNQIRKQKN